MTVLLPRGGDAGAFPGRAGPALGVLAHSGKTLGDGLPALRSALARAGCPDVPWCEVSASKKAPKKVRRLLDSGVERLLVWGGDGTVRRCVDAIVRAEAHADVAILPAGTANLLAHALEIPIDFDGALDVALHGPTRPIDVGMMNGEAFLVMAGAGFDALLIRDAQETKDRLGRLAYVRAGARHLRGGGAAAEIKVDGRPWFSGHTACVLIGNTGTLMGGVRAFPDARFDDGWLDVGVVTALTRRDWLRVGVRAVTGRIDGSPLVDIAQGRRIKFRLDRKLPWQLDGGDRPPAKAFDATILPARVSVCVGPR